MYLLFLYWCFKIKVKQRIYILNDKIAQLTKGPFIYYVITFLGFLDPPPPYVSMFLVLRISKNWHFLEV